MRQARGKIDQLSGYFHVENSLRPDIAPFSNAAIEQYRAILFAELERAGLIPQLEAFHPRGFGLLLEKPSGSGARPGDAAQPSSCIKTLKQRIARLYNRETGHTGAIWQDRTKLFFVPEALKSRIEVAAYILARPWIEGSGALPEWPSTFTEACAGEPRARDALIRLFGRRRWDPTLPEQLERESARILEQCRQPLKSKGRGRPGEWRPLCERKAPSAAVIPPPDPRAYRKNRDAAKRNFQKMLERYQATCRKHGFSQIPHGFFGESALRKWATRQRGEFQRGRLPDWKLRALRGTTVLEAVKPANPAPEEPWRLPTHLL